MTSPKFKHDCNECTFYTHYKGRDIYKHNDSIISRWGDNGPEYDCIWAATVTNSMLLSPRMREAYDYITKIDNIKKHKRWYIKIRWKGVTPIGHPLDWKSWMRSAVVPILFKSESDAQDYINAHMFKNLNHRKMSCSIETRWLGDGK